MSITPNVLRTTITGFDNSSFNGVFDQVWFGNCVWGFTNGDIYLVGGYGQFGTPSDTDGAYWLAMWSIADGESFINFKGVSRTNVFPVDFSNVHLHNSNNPSLFSGSPTVTIDPIVTDLVSGGQRDTYAKGCCACCYSLTTAPNFFQVTLSGFINAATILNGTWNLANAGNNSFGTNCDWRSGVTGAQQVFQFGLVPTGQFIPGPLTWSLTANYITEGSGTFQWWFNGDYRQWDGTTDLVLDLDFQQPFPGTGPANAPNQVTIHPLPDLYLAQSGNVVFLEPPTTTYGQYGTQYICGPIDNLDMPNTFTFDAGSTITGTSPHIAECVGLGGMRTLTKVPFFDNTTNVGQYTDYNGVDPYWTMLLSFWGPLGIKYILYDSACAIHGSATTNLFLPSVAYTCDVTNLSDPVNGPFLFKFPTPFGGVSGPCSSNEPIVCTGFPSTILVS